MAPSLHNLRVCDLTQNLAGPFCTQILGDLGADVIKVQAAQRILARLQDLSEPLGLPSD